MKKGYKQVNENCGPVVDLHPYILLISLEIFFIYFIDSSRQT